jgi:transposase
MPDLGMDEGYRTQDLGHLGVVSAMIDELGFVQLIDTHIKQDHSQCFVTTGQAVKALIINGLGFIARRLYLVPDFFRGKPVDELIAKGITSDHLNDDTLGRALDRIYGHGVTSLFSLLAAQGVTRLGLAPKVGHEDTTSFHTDGDYNSEAPKSEVEDQGIVRITRGYSRDKRPDLNQIGLELIVEHQAGLPIAMSALSGNMVDTKALKESISTHIAQLQNIGVTRIVRDAAGYTEESLKALQEAGQTWIMRVPHTIKSAISAIKESDLSKFQSYVPDYLYSVIDNNYADVKQRWLVIYPLAAKEREIKTQSQKFLKISAKECSAWSDLSRREFSCHQDAIDALERFKKTLKVCSISGEVIQEIKHYAKPGRPAPGTVPKRVGYIISGSISAEIKPFMDSVNQGMMFILATNELDVEKLSDKEVISDYKDQSKVERGFRFMKDPFFQASSIFLKNPQRLVAVMMIMTLSLFVYAAIEHRVRQVLDKNQASIPDQKGKPTKRPTARWMFELFRGVHLLTLPPDDGKQRVLTMNLRPELRSLLLLLGTQYQVLYP